MTDERSQHSMAPTPQEEKPFGGEVEVRGGAPPRWMRWITYVLFAWAIIYLLVHPQVEDHFVVLIIAGVLIAWVVLFTVTKGPAEP